METAADRAMPGPAKRPTSKSPAMRRLLASDWFRPTPEIPPVNTRDVRLKNHEAVLVDTLPKCDFCAAEATFDGKMKSRSSWANMCHVHFEVHGVGLGLGVGQELVLRGS